MAAFPENFVMNGAPEIAAMPMFGGEPFLPGTDVLQVWKEETDYSEKYCDDVYEYRRVTVPRPMLQVLPMGRCMHESEWRHHGITMSRGWEHYDHHSPEANVLLFRRVIGTDPKTGKVPDHILQKVQEREQYIAELERMRQSMGVVQMRGRGLATAEQYGGA